MSQSLPTERKQQGFDPTKLKHGEVFWRDHYKWLEASGYRLRPRYKPDWKPSWVDRKSGKETKAWFLCEDGQRITVGLLLSTKPGYTR